MSNFETPLERAEWEFDGDKFDCRLTHEVENFGRFVLSRSAGHGLVLALQSDWLPDDGLTATFSLQQPGWQPSAPEQGDRFDARWHRGEATLVAVAAPFLQALELGWNWRADLNDGAGQGWRVSSANVHGQPAALEMRRCLKRLLPMSYEQVRRLELNYASGGIEPPGPAGELIAAAAAYVQADARIKRVLVDGHTDSDGDSLANLVLSRTRADEVAARLVAAGVEADKIEIRGHGERFPIVSNGSSKGRERNRRVTIRLVMEEQPATAAADNGAPDMSATLPKTLSDQVDGQ
ncbi:MotY family protein [Ferrimonas sediminicola]|nr:OmpA family protein [Ferrimonas sediminicola]